MRTFHDSVRTVVEQLPASPTAFERDDALGLYPRQAVMDRFVEKDQKSFLQAVNRLYGLGPDQAPPKIDLMLDRVSRRFLDEPLNVQTAATELGMAKPERIQAAFQNRELAAAGLMPLASGGTVRRDTWEDFYDQVADHFGRGVPIVPIDGVTRPEYQRPDTRVTFEPKANRKTFGKGDVLVITVKNTSAAPLFLEAVLSGNEGQKVMLTDTVTRVEAGATIRFPPGEGKGFEMSGVTGKEQVVVYAAEKQFPKGEVLLFPEKDGDAGFGMADRVVHRQFFRLSENGGRPAFDPSRMVKKTIEIETQ
jgi:serine/threonine-protein kinase